MQSRLSRRARSHLVRVFLPRDDVQQNSNNKYFYPLLSLFLKSLLLLPFESFIKNFSKKKNFKKKRGVKSKRNATKERGRARAAGIDRYCGTRRWQKGTRSGRRREPRRRRRGVLAGTKERRRRRRQKIDSGSAERLNAQTQKVVPSPSKTIRLPSAEQAASLDKLESFPTPTKSNGKDAEKRRNTCGRHRMNREARGRIKRIQICLNEERKAKPRRRRRCQEESDCR